MELIADILLISGALVAAIYCVVLSRRLRRFTDLEKGVGGAIAVLSVQVDDMTKTLGSAQISAVESTQSLDRLTSRAEGVARRLELLVASMHDIPDESVSGTISNPEQPQHPPQFDEPSPGAVPQSNEAVDPVIRETREPGPVETPDEPKAEPLFLSVRSRVSEAAE